MLMTKKPLKKQTTPPPNHIQMGAKPFKPDNIVLSLRKEVPNVLFYLLNHFRSSLQHFSFWFPMDSLSTLDLLSQALNIRSYNP